MDIIRSGINTRLVTKEEYKNVQANILDTRSLQNQSIMENIGDSDYNFNKLNNDINKQYESTYNKYLNSLDNNPKTKESDLSVKNSQPIINKVIVNKKCKNIINYNKQGNDYLLKIINKVLIKKNIIYDQNHLSKLIDTYNISYSNPQKNLLKQIINEISQLSKTTDNSPYIEPKRIYITTLISISSKDRDCIKFPDPNNFTISLIENSRLNNISSVQIVSSIFPKKCINGMNLEDYPYISIEINEFGSNYNSNNTFAQLTYDMDMGKFKKCIARSPDEYKKSFFPYVSIDKITISIKNSDNKMYNFKNIDDKIDDTVDDDVESNEPITYDPDKIPEETTFVENDAYLPVHFVFKITYLQEELTNKLSKNIFSDI